MASMVPLAVLDDRRAIWLVPASYLWWILVATLGYAWGTTLAFFLPLLALVTWRWYEHREARLADREGVLPVNAG